MQTEVLFVSIQPPYRKAKLQLISVEVDRRFLRLGIVPPRRGAHALRHACASELLRNGASLVQLADFLGHKGVSTVSRYTKHNAKSLMAVAEFSLEAVLCAGAQC
jgi:integrase/recombinase XerD